MGNRYKPLQMVYNRETPIERDTGYVMALKQLDPPFTFKVSFKPPCFIRSVLQPVRCVLHRTVCVDVSRQVQGAGIGASWCCDVTSVSCTL